MYQIDLPQTVTENQTLIKIKIETPKIETAILLIINQIIISQTTKNREINLRKTVTTTDPAIKVGIKTEISAET